jgi:hypothetical protein
MEQQNSQNTGNQGGEGRDRRDWGNNRNDWRDEKRPRDPMRGLFGGLILILLGVLFFASMQNWISWDRWWQIFLIGLGGIFLIDALIIYVNKSVSHGVFGRIITGLILITIGTAFLIHLEQWWPLILIIIGVAIVFRFIVYRR